MDPEIAIVYRQYPRDAVKKGSIRGASPSRKRHDCTMSWIEILFGRPLASSEEGEQRVGVLAGIPMLGLDALASAAYGPEAALTLLIPLGALGLAFIGPISLLIIVLLLI